MKRTFWAVPALLTGLLTASGWADEPKKMPPREAQEWCNIVSYDAASAKLPRVLLIGDSIAGRYASAMRQALKDKAYVTVMSTSKAVGDPSLLDEIKAVLGQYTYAAVHFNIGLHGGGGRTAYRQGFPDLIATIKAGAPGAKLIWATTTPCRGDGMTQNVREFNKIAAEFIEKEGIAVDDLYGLVVSNAENPKVLWDGGGVHFTEEGAALQGNHVAQSILALLPTQP